MFSHGKQSTTFSKAFFALSLCLGLLVSSSVVPSSAYAFDLFKLKRPNQPAETESDNVDESSDVNSNTNEQADDRAPATLDGNTLTAEELNEVPVAKTYPVESSAGADAKVGAKGYPRWRNVPPPPSAPANSGQLQPAQQVEKKAAPAKRNYRLDHNGFLVPVESINTDTSGEAANAQRPSAVSSEENERPNEVNAIVRDVNGQIIAPISAPSAAYTAPTREESNLGEVPFSGNSIVQPTAQPTTQPVQERPRSLFIAPTREERATMGSVEPSASETAPQNSRYPAFKNDSSDAAQTTEAAPAGDAFTAPVFSEESGYVDVPDSSGDMPVQGSVGSAVSTDSVSFGSTSFDNRAVVKARLETSRPDVKVRSITESPLPGMYRVEFNGGLVAFVTSDARFFVLGDLFQVDQGQGFINLGEQQRRERRVEELQAVSPDETINYAALGASYKGRIFVFTDGDCGSCRRLHQEVPKLMELGVEVRYLAFPRGFARHGKLDRGYRSMVSAWCAEDKEAALDELKAGRSIPDANCVSNPVAEQFTLGSRLGIATTPTIVTESGQLLTGFLSADRIAAIVSERGAGL